MQCVHGNHYACNSEGVLELRPEYDELTDEATMALIIGGCGFFIVYIGFLVLFLKIAQVWRPVVVKK